VCIDVLEENAKYDPEDGGSVFLSNVGTHLKDNTVS
jgi:hypothetical protein